MRAFLAFSRVAGWLMVATGLMVLASQWLNLSPLSAALPGKASTSTHGAIAMCLSGGALLLTRASGWRRVWLGPLLSLTVLGLGMGTLVEHVLVVDLGVERDLARASDRVPRRMTELVAAAMVLLGVLGVLVSARRYLWLRELIALVLLAMAMTGLASHGITLAGADNSLFGRMPIHTTVMLLLATLGWLSATPTVGLTRVTTAATVGGAFARRVLLPALLLPIAFTYLFQMFQTWWNLSQVLAVALMAVFSGGAVAWLIWWVALLLDKLERQRHESARLRTDADTDALTALPNRRAFDMALDHLLQGHRERDTVFSLLMLDLDRFKSYNDDFGHLVGDEVLRITGRLLDVTVRPEDMAARYGGEEFALLLPATDAASAVEVAQRVLEAFRDFAWPHRAVTASIGVAQSVPGDDAAALISRADAALYAAKDAGRDCVKAASPDNASTVSVAR